MAGLRDITEFDVYKLADELRIKLRVVVDRPDVRRIGWLHDQLERAMEGPCAHLAEGFARYQPLDFARFVRIARGSLSETITHLGTANARRLITTEELTDFVRLAKRAIGASTALICYLERATEPGRDRPKRRRGRTRNREPEL
jgi:four helix bundle protein